jgi:hypothetical protein
MQTPKPGEQRRPAQPSRVPADDENERARIEDSVDQASAASMIASDPPARSGFRLGPAKKPRRKNP